MISGQSFKNLRGGRNENWIFSPAHKTAEEMLIAWKTDLIKLEATQFDNYFLSTIFLKSIVQGFRCGFLVFMVLPRTGEKRIFELKNDLGNLIEGGWCIGEDFNEVLYSEDRNGRRSSSVQRRKFHE